MRALDSGSLGDKKRLSPHMQGRHILDVLKKTVGFGYTYTTGQFNHTPGSTDQLIDR